ncbi:MAG TPA: ferrochelatase, partial [Turneriella sp.]|nr:ferrochelatase [Turneriella sp.]
AFQSRLGRGKWLTPMTSDTIAHLPTQGIKHLAVLAPSFVADNLETLHEIDIEYRHLFLSAGGKSFTYIPCLNDDTRWVKGFAAFIDKNYD